MKTPAQRPSEMTSAVNLMVHPAAGTMALSTLGFSMASHALVTWVSTMSAVAEASQRFWQPLLSSPVAKEVETRPVPVVAPPRDNVVPMRGNAEKVARTASRAKLAGQAVLVATPSVKPVAHETVKRTVAVSASQSAAPRAPAAFTRPEQPDDLKAISGIGPKLEQVLNGLGVWTYAQIAAWGADEIAWVDDSLGFKGRIVRDGWTAQAASLATGDKVAG